jgi:hypothetical protein
VRRTRIGAVALRGEPPPLPPNSTPAGSTRSLSPLRFPVCRFPVLPPGWRCARPSCGEYFNGGHSWSRVGGVSRGEHAGRGARCSPLMLLSTGRIGRGLPARPRRRGTRRRPPGRPLLAPTVRDTAHLVGSWRCADCLGAGQGGSLASPALKRERALVAAVGRSQPATVAALLDDLDGRLPPV